MNLPNLANFWTIIAGFLMQNVQGLGAVASIGFGLWIMVTPNKHNVIPKAIGLAIGLLVAIWGPSLIALLRSAGGGQVIVQ